jgi:hypothetical protein
MKAHLIDADAPVKEGSDLIVNCGATVPNGRFVFLWDSEEYPEFLSVSMTRVCRKCASLELEKKYVYGVVSGQEVMDAESVEREAVEAA